MYLIRILFLAFTLCTAMATTAKPADETEIRNILQQQSAAWNRGDITGFMKGYWENDSLMFIGKKGITYGWKNTLENYKKSYPGKEAMGTLRFDIIQIKSLSEQYQQVTGQWHLQRNTGDLEGHFTLLFRKIKDQWVIINDHSS